MNHIILTLSITLMTSTLLAQNPGLDEGITGTITGPSGEPVPGVNVIEQGTANGTVTDIDGNYRISVSSEEAILTFSFIGYKTVDIPIDGQSSIDVTMQEDLTTLDEIEIYATGYQQLPAERATGSFEHIDNELLNRSVSTDVISRLEGVTPGLLFNSTNISDESISIRGRSTLLSAAAAEPLIVLNNFPYEGDLSTINPNDIESITVLKDAAAASIWGARAGNGVIVITTKKGTKNTPLQVSFNSNVTIAQKPDLHYNQNYLESPAYIEVERYLFDQGFYDSRINSLAQPALTPVVALLAQHQAGELSDQALEQQLQALAGRDVRDDFDRHIYRKAINQQYALNFRGGSDRMAYKLSLGYDHNMEALNHNNYERFTTSFRNTFTPANNLDVTLGMMYARTKENNPNNYAFGSASTAYRATDALYPYADLTGTVPKDFNGAYKDSLTATGLLDWQYRPLDELNLIENTTTVHNLLMNVQLHYAITPHLAVIGQYQRQEEITQTHNLTDAASYEVRNEVNKYAALDDAGVYTFPFPQGDILNIRQSNLWADNLRTQVTFDRQFGNSHTFNAIAGAEIRETQSEGYSRISYGYDDALGTAVANLDYNTRFGVRPYGTAPLPAPPGSVSGTTNRYLSRFANLAYTYDQRYTLSLSGRRDGANIFGVNTNDKITPLWSAGAAWHISNEHFFGLNWLPYLKLRTTYGYNGNVYNASAYLTARYLTSSFTGLPTASVTAPPNPELRWERVRNVNVAVDFELQKQIISGTLAWYRKDGTDLIEDAPLPLSTGFTTFKGNAASVRTQGLDMQLTSRNIDRTFKWQTTWILNLNKDKITHFDPEYNAASLVSGNGNGSGALVAVEGNPLFGLYSYAWAGLDSEGDPQGYLEGQVSKDYLAILNNATPDSLVFHGSARPVTFGALRNTFSWKGLSLSLNISYKLGYYFRKSTIRPNYTDIVATTPHSDYNDRWKEPGDENHTSVPALVYPADNNRDNFYRYSEVLVEPADHIRLKDIRLAYAFEATRMKALPFQHLQLYLYLNNLGILWRANDKGLDPDFNNARVGIASYPTPLTASLGLSATF